MCGIVAATLSKPVLSILLDGLKNLEYRGYDSAGVAMHSGDALKVFRAAGKVAQLDESLKGKRIQDSCGIAHTRWATHGEVSERNAHPHMSGKEIALVHNGIIENHALLRAELSEAGYRFQTDTDTEVVVHLIEQRCREGADLVDAVRYAQSRLEGSYALVVMRRTEPGRIVAARLGSPLVLAHNEQGYLIASDVTAVNAVAQDFIYPEEGDIVSITASSMQLFDKNAKPVERESVTIDEDVESVSLGKYEHYMQKETWEQPKVIAGLVSGLASGDILRINDLGRKERDMLGNAQGIHIVACGTSYHAGLVARYWFEEIAGLSCTVDIASEYRYRTVNVPKNTLFLAISQSGETADTLAALRKALGSGYMASWAICNVARSTVTREADCTMLTRAGIEIGVASTKAFTTQLTILLALCLMVAHKRSGLSASDVAAGYQAMKLLPEQMRAILKLDKDIEAMAGQFKKSQHVLFLGRGIHYPVAMEGALKMKEISYIHAEPYAAGELKHGPLALVDKQMPIIALVPEGALHEKMVSNLEEVHVRGGSIYAFCDEGTAVPEQLSARTLFLPKGHRYISPILYALPLQMLAYHVALDRGANVDQPRNLAKSVTVE
jgi:glucosamine--fructose-6-phosphate aminotransferase (isomerizing)